MKRYILDTVAEYEDPKGPWVLHSELKGMQWIDCKERMPELIEECESMWGGQRRSADCIVLYADDSEHWDSNGPHISSAFVLEYDSGHLEWMYRIDRTGGLERCSSHGGPIPTHWMPIP